MDTLRDKQRLEELVGLREGPLEDVVTNGADGGFSSPVTPASKAAGSHSGLPAGELRYGDMLSTRSLNPIFSRPLPWLPFSMTFAAIFATTPGSNLR
jgi:hypothetical protein